ncbi:MAG: hypothetical protein KAS04_04415 [Candidatus Aenigmarchaeota archaeon]|nr:hypothetical protein [Candidatus Aenigmarchaeota archaeon]
MPPVHPIWIFGSEVVYFIAVAILCLGIYLRTKDIYALSRLKTIFHFRNIFLYFFLAYAFRFVYLFILLSSDLGFRSLMIFQIFGMLVVSYFSTMAILSVLMTVLVKRISTERKHVNILLHISSIVLLAVVFVTGSLYVLAIFHIAILAFAAITMILKRKGSHFSNQNRITYILLFIFWIINLFEFGRGNVQFITQLGVHAISVAIFLSIYLRLRKRLKNAEKKGKTRNNK